MADNVTANQGTGGPVFATDQRTGGEHVPAMKLELGADGTFDGYVSSTNPLPITGGGSVAAGNTTTDSPLSSGQSYVGSWDDVTAFGSISVLATTNVPGTLYAEFSVDGITADRILQLSTGDVAISAIHTLIPVAQYFRVRVVNGAAGQASFRMQTMYHPTARIAQPTSRIYQSLGSYQDVLNVRTGNQPELDVARGLVGGQMVVHKFGNNGSVGTSVEDITASGVINWLQAATTVRVAAGNADDGPGGGGALKVKVEGLDENWLEVEEEITTAGASASSPTTTTFIRVNRVYVTETGTYGGANTANVVIENSAGTTDLATIVTGMGQTQTTQYTVPAGRTAYLTRLSAVVSGNQSALVRFKQRSNADDVTTPFSPFRLVHEFPAFSGTSVLNLKSYISFPEKTDLRAEGATANSTTSVSVDYCLILIDD